MAGKVNPFQSIIDFADKVVIEEDLRASRFLGNTLKDPEEWRESFPDKEKHLNKLKADALSARECTGFSVEKVERRLNAVIKEIKAIMIWPRDFPKPDPTQEDLRRAKGRASPVSLYLIQHNDALSEKCEAIQTLAIRYASFRKRMLESKSGSGGRLPLNRSSNLTDNNRAILNRHPPPDSSLERDCFYKDGTIFHVEAFGCSVPLRSVKGMGTLHKLLKQPGKPILMQELLRDEGVNSDLANSLRMSKQDKTDHDAFAAYKERLAENESELQEAIRDNDEAAKERAYLEQEALRKEIESVKGLGGKMRELDSNIGRWRSAIYRRLNTVYKQFEAATPSLNELANHIRASTWSEGDSYVYRPSDSRINWRTEK